MSTTAFSWTKQTLVGFLQSLLSSWNQKLWGHFMTPTTHSILALFQHHTTKFSQVRLVKLWNHLSTWNFYQFHIYWTLSKIKTKQNFWFKIFQKVEFLGQWRKSQNFNYQISMTKFSIIKHLNFIQKHIMTPVFHATFWEYLNFLKILDARITL